MVLGENFPAAMARQGRSWAKAEKLEISVPQSELWNYGDAPSRMTERIRKWLKGRNP